MTAFENLAKTAQLAINENRPEFERHLDELPGKIFQVMWQQDWFVVDRFKRLSEEWYLFPDRSQHEELVARGQAAINADDMRSLRRIVFEMDGARIGTGIGDDPVSAVNIVRA